MDFFFHRQMAAGKMLQLLRQWHHPQKDPEAFIRILPTEFIHLSTTFKKKWTDLAIHSIKLRNSLSHSFKRYCEILTRKKSYFLCDEVGHLEYKQKKNISNQYCNHGDVCTDFTLYSEGWGYLFTRNVFTHNDEMLW